ncbi:hypothetical protein CA3LBN_003515 [Candidozyma haemuli]|uniref:RFX-type winged-helix domain-containing protein n=1 Tax=Candidozyma haemuli TaxID=45357 RepID=A0ABX8I7X6_9ASCO|nr:hypothetical protein CA3LBN_003515 [[Candida] haemuloni]
MDMFSLNNSLSDRPEAPNQYTTQSSMSLSSHEDKSHSSNAPVMPTGSATIFPHQQSSSTFTDASTLTHSRDETLQAILSDMLKLDAFNLNTFLLSLLRRVDKSLPLDEFYNVLYNPKSDNGALQSAINKIDKTETSDDSESGMEIIQRVLEVFRFPETLYNQYPSLDGSDLKASNVNLHELLRSLLAIKILRHSLIETEDGDRHSERSPIPRLDIYKVYYILCQKLILKYPSSSNTTSLQQKLIFGQSKLGKLIKLVYPNLVSKRLGRRGESRYNYLGIRWNDNVVSDEIKALFRNDLPELADIFKVSKKVAGASHSKSTLRRQQSSSRPSQNKRNRSISQTEMINRIKAQGTFVEPTHFFPEGPFTSKAFLDEHLNDNIERNWFAAALKLSSDALEESGVSSDEIHRLLFGEDEPLTEEDDILLRGIIDIVLPKLSASPNQPKIFLHLFMVISLKVFPHLLSLRKPLHTENIKRLTSKVSYLIKRIEGEMSPLVSQKMQQHDIRNFLGILSRMIHLNQLLAAFFKADLQDYILKEMQEDVTRVATEGSKDGLNETYRLISEACISVLLANRYKPQFRGVPVKSNIRQFLFESCHTIEQMVSHDLASFVTNVMEGWLPQTEESFHGALKFRLLLATLKLVDEGVLNEDMKARFPASGPYFHAWWQDNNTCKPNLSTLVRFRELYSGIFRHRKQDKTILELISKRNRLDRKINEMLNEAAEQTDPRKIIDLDEAKSFVNRYLLRQKEKSQQISSLIDKHKRFQQDAAQQKKVILEDHEKLSPKKISGLTKLSQLNSSEKSRLDEELKKRLQSHYEMVADRQRQLSQESDAMLHELGVPFFVENSQFDHLNHNEVTMLKTKILKHLMKALS